METNIIIKNRRRELGLTMKEVAEELGVSESLISRYESKDVKNMGIDKLIPLAKVLKCSPAYLMGLENKDGLISVCEEKEEYKLTDTELAEFEKLKNMQTSLFLFNDKQLSADAMEKFERALLEAFIDTIKQRKGDTNK